MHCWGSPQIKTLMKIPECGTVFPIKLKCKYQLMKIWGLPYLKCGVLYLRTPGELSSTVVGFFSIQAFNLVILRNCFGETSSWLLAHTSMTGPSRGATIVSLGFLSCLLLCSDPFMIFLFLGSCLLAITPIALIFSFISSAGTLVLAEDDELNSRNPIV